MTKKNIEYRTRNFECRSEKAEDRGQRTEDRGQKTEDRRPAFAKASVFAKATTDKTAGRQRAEVRTESGTMDKRIITEVALIFLTIVGVCRACECKEDLLYDQPPEKETGPVETILKQLNQKTKELKSYEGKIEYLFRQPLFDSRTLRKGVLYYEKSDKKSKLRINFKTLKQDDEEEQKYRDEHIFDGVWLTHIDYQIKNVQKRQLAEPNKPVDAFELASQNFPIIGFSKIEDLKKEFEIELVEQEESEQSQFIKLHLKVKPDSIYKDDYTYIDLWIDKELYLPAKIATVSTEEDIYEIKLLKPKVNKKINKKVFEFKVPKGFSEEIIPLKKKN